MGALGVLLGCSRGGLGVLFGGRFWGYWDALGFVFCISWVLFWCSLGALGGLLGAPLLFSRALRMLCWLCKAGTKEPKGTETKDFRGALKAAGPSSLLDKLPIYKIKGGRGRRP